MFNGEVPKAAIRKAYLVLKAGTHRMEDDQQKLATVARKNMEPAIRARRDAMREIEKWWPTIAEEIEL
jgi:predicted nucleotidyltransferase